MCAVQFFLRFIQKKKGGIRTEASSVHAKHRGGEREELTVREGGEKKGEDLSLSAGECLSEVLQLQVYDRSLCTWLSVDASGT